MAEIEITYFYKGIKRLTSINPPIYSINMQYFFQIILDKNNLICCFSKTCFAEHCDTTFNKQSIAYNIQNNSLADLGEGQCIPLHAALDT